MGNLPEDKRRTITTEIHGEFVHNINIDVLTMTVQLGVVDRDENNDIVPGTNRVKRNIPLLDDNGLPNVPDEMKPRFQQCYTDLLEIAVQIAKQNELMSPDVDTSL